MYHMFSGCTNLEYLNLSNTNITVTGSAYKIVKSDTGILRLEIKTRKTEIHTN